MVHFTSEVATLLPEDFFVRVAEETLRRCPLRGLADKESVTFNAISVAPEKIRELNKTYRGKDAVTDILSFGEYADTSVFEQETRKEIFLGEIFFCQDVIATAAQEDGVTLEHEMTYVFSHGILHVLGYDHSDEMFAEQDAVTEYLMKPAGKNI